MTAETAVVMGGMVMGGMVMGGMVIGVVVMGVAGAGKTTLGTALAQQLTWTYLDADDLHPPANIAKMASGQPLTDADREPWLRAVRDWMDANRPCVVACSALRRRYRDVLRAPGVLFVQLDGTPELLYRRLAERPGHFMPPELLDSQLRTLERPGSDENVVLVDAAAALPRQVRAVIEALERGSGERG